MLQPVPERLRKLAVDAVKENGYTIDNEGFPFCDKKDCYRPYVVNVCGSVFADCKEDELVLTVSTVRVTMNKETIEKSKYEPFTINMSEVEND